MTISMSDFVFVRTLLNERTAIVLDDDRSYFVDHRLSPVARESGFTDVEQLISQLRRNGDKKLESDVIDALTTNETSWLRDVEPFQVLMKVLLPELMAARGGSRRLAFWSAGCATGQEPYSLAMMLEDILPPIGWDYVIVATDISRTALARAESGVFRQMEVNRGLPASLLVRHFERAGVNWRISPYLRSRVMFKRHNLVLDPPPLTRADVVLMRNVLIYFDVATRRHVLDRVRPNMAPDGVLLLGSAESTLGLSTGWTRRMHGRTTISRPDPSVKGTPGLAPPTVGGSVRNDRAPVSAP